MKHLYTLLLLFCLTATPVFAVQELVQTGATTPIPFLLVDSATGQIGQTGQASNITVTVCKPVTTSFVASSGTITEIGNGLYNYTPTATETGSGTTTGIILLHITDTIDNTPAVDISAQIVAFNPNDAAALGLTDIATTYSTSTSTLGEVSSILATTNTINTNTTPATYSIQAASTTTGTAETLTAKEYAQLGTSEIVGNRNFTAISGSTQTGTVYLAGYGTTYPVETITINTTTGQVVNRLIVQPFPNEP